MECRIYAYCSRELAADQPPNPGTVVDGESTEVDTINGFYVGSIFAGHVTDPQMNAHLSGKFRFRRKCDRNTRIVLSADSLVRLGSARSVSIFGAMDAVLRVR